MMVVNAQPRAGAKCKAGDTVAVLMELDEDKRTVARPANLLKIIDCDPKARESWPKLSFLLNRKNMCERSRALRG